MRLRSHIAALLVATCALVGLVTPAGAVESGDDLPVVYNSALGVAASLAHPGAGR